MSIADSALAVTDVRLDDVPTTPAGHHTPADRVFRGLSTAAACVSLVIVGGTLIFLVDQARPAFKTSGDLELLHDERVEPGRRPLRRARPARGNADHRARSRWCIAVPLGVGDGAVHQRVRAGRGCGGSSRRWSTCSPRCRACCSASGRSFALQEHLVPVARLPDAPPLGAAVPAASSSGAALVGFELHRGRRGRDHDPADRHVGLARRHGAGAARTVRGRARARRNALGHDPQRHPAVRAQRHRRRVDPRLRPRARRDDRGRARSSARSSRSNTHILQGGASSVASHIAVHFGEATTVERSGLVAAGLALFLLTFAVSLVARFIVVRGDE